MIKNLALAGLIGASAIGGYGYAKWQNSGGKYSIVTKEGKSLLYSEDTRSYHQIQNISGTIVVGTAKENLNGYDILRTQEITELVVNQYLAKPGKNNSTNDTPIPESTSKEKDNGKRTSLEDSIKHLFR